MEDLLNRLKSRRAIMRFALTDDGEALKVDIWMNGTSYIDEAVKHVRKTVEASAQDLAKPVRITIAAVLECFDVGPGHGAVKRTYHQAVEKSD